jgi:predicted sulfurtransferase
MEELKRAIALSLGVLLFCWANASAEGAAGYGLINAEALKKNLDDAVEMIVVDARNPEEFQEVHIQGAISVPIK